MPAKACINDNKVKKIIDLNSEGLNPVKIAATLDISQQSVMRVLRVAKTAKEKGIKQAEIEHPDIGLNIRQSVYRILNMQNPGKEIDNSATALVRILEELRKNNELLEKLLAVWQS